MTLGVTHFGDPDWFWEQSPGKQKDIIITFEAKHQMLNQQGNPKKPSQEYRGTVENQGKRRPMTAAEAKRFGPMAKQKLKQDLVKNAEDPKSLDYWLSDS